MERYKNIDGDSGVIAYEFGSDFIRVQFSTLSVYLYTYESAGSHNVEYMKKLAANGDGLNSFINTNVKRLYAKREK